MDSATVDPVPIESLDPVAVGVVLLAVAVSLTVTARVVTRWRCGMAAIPWRPHAPVPWGGVDVALVLAAYVVCAALAAMWLPAEPSLVSVLLANLTTLAGTMLFALVHLRHRGADRQSLGVGLAAWPDDVRLGVGGLALVIAPLLGLATILDRIVPYRHPLVDLLAVDRSPGTLVVVLVSAVVAAPIAEELFFRRILQGWLEARLSGDGGRGAVAFSAALFAIAHVGQGLAYVPLFLLGLVLGWIARQTGSIIGCVVLHALFNAVSVAIVLLTTQPAANP